MLVVAGSAAQWTPAALSVLATLIEACVRPRRPRGSDDREAGVDCSTVPLMRPTDAAENSQICTAAELAHDGADLGLSVLGGDAVVLGVRRSLELLPSSSSGIVDRPPWAVDADLPVVRSMVTLAPTQDGDPQLLASDRSIWSIRAGRMRASPCKAPSGRTSCSMPPLSCFFAA